jgi:hypothetical protein
MIFDKVCIGEKMPSLTNAAGKTAYTSAEDLTRSQSLTLY